MEAIVNYNRSLDPGEFSHLDCGCKSVWTESLEDRRDCSDFFGDFVRVARTEGLPAVSS